MSSGPVTYLSDETEELCQRCNEKKAVLLSRKEKFCPGCFVFFMRGKQRKSMLDERYKVKYGAIADRQGVQKVLLPLSFGASSLVLLDMVASLLLEQSLAHKGKQGFELEVLHLIEPKIATLATNSKANVLNILEEIEQDSMRKLFASLAKRYFPLELIYHEVDLNTYVMDNVTAITVKRQFEVIASEASEISQKSSVADLLKQCATRALQEDLVNVLKTALTRKIALEMGFQTIIYGHSMTRLANEVIALTVTGRGSTTHESVINRPIKYNNVDLQIIFPLRNILKGEVTAILLFDKELRLFLKPETKPGSRLAKNMTVHDLTTQYFDNLDAAGYASTASTVVKTAEKLGAPKEPELGQCEVCGSSFHRDSRKWLSGITVTTAAPLVTDQELEYAREYAREYALPEAVAPGRKLQICYGCTITLAEAGKSFDWPTRPSKEEILDEFALTDDDGNEWNTDESQ